MKIFAIANQKGGTGKSSSSFAIGHALAEFGHRVLLVDLDPQSSLTVSVGFDIKALEKEKTLCDLLLAVAKDQPLDPADVVRETGVPGLRIIPTTSDLAEVESHLMGELGRDGILKNALSQLGNAYDFAIIDCPPSLTLLTTNALTAATHVIVPIEPDYLAMKGAELLVKTVRRVQRKTNPTLTIWRILITKHDGRTLHAKEILESISAKFADLVFPTPIKLSVRMKEAPVKGQSILGYEPHGDNAQTYRSLAQELSTHV